VGDNSSDSEDEFFDANERPSEADAGALADQESGDSSESSIVVIEELADGLADMLTRNADVCAALAPEFLKETIAQFATHGSKLRRARTGCGMAIKLEMNLSAEQVDLLNEICAPIAEELGVPGLKLFASSWQIKGELDTYPVAFASVARPLHLAAVACADDFPHEMLVRPAAVPRCRGAGARHVRRPGDLPGSRYEPGGHPRVRDRAQCDETAAPGRAGALGDAA
jgi:hypothetical protein